MLQAGVIAAGLEGLNNRTDPGEPLNCNMYEDYKNYSHLKKLPDEIEDSIKELEDSKELKEAFGEDVINSYIKLKKEEIDEFNRQESFNKKDPITEWERKSTLDC